MNSCGGLLIIHSLPLEVNKFIKTKLFSVTSAETDFVDYFGFDVISRQINSFDLFKSKTQWIHQFGQKHKPMHNILLRKDRKIFKS